MSSASSPFQTKSHLEPRLLYVSSPTKDDSMESEDRSHLKPKRSEVFKHQVTSIFGKSSNPLPWPSPRQDSETKSHQRALSSWSTQRPDHNSSDTRHDTTAPEALALSQALGEAIIQDVVAVPHEHADLGASSGRKRRKSVASRAVSVVKKAIRGGDKAMPTQDQSNDSSAMTSNLMPKLMVVTRDSGVLQYSQAGNVERLPEKVMRLGAGTTRISVRTLAGNLRVLQLVQQARNIPNGKDIASMSRASLFSTSSESSCEVWQLRLVFEDSSKFDKWLATLRRDKNVTEGLQHDSSLSSLDDESHGTGGPHSLDIHDGFSQFPSAPYVFPLQRARQHVLRDSPSQSPHSKRSPASSLCGVSTTDMPFPNATELDHLRETSVMERSWLSDTKSSYDASVALNLVFSHSPKLEDFPLTPGINATANFGPGLHSKKSAPAPILVPRDSRKRSNSCSAALPSPELTRTPTFLPDDLHAFAGKFAPKPYTHIHNPVEATKMANWIDGLTRARESDETSTQSSDAVPSLSDTIAVSVTSTLVSSNNDCEIHKTDIKPEGYSPNVPTVDASPDFEGLESETSLAPPPYSLAPKRSSSLDAGLMVFQSPSPAVVNSRTSTKIESNALPLQHIATDSQLAVPHPAAGFAARKIHRKALSAVTSHSHLAIDKAHNPERSPSVNDAHLATCFGVDTPFDKQSIHMDGQSLDFPTKAKTLESSTCPTLQKAIDLPCLTPALTRSIRSRLRQKSLPNILYKAETPLTPPPTTPLPILPSLSTTPGAKAVQHRRRVSAEPLLPTSIQVNTTHRRRKNSVAQPVTTPSTANSVQAFEKEHAGKRPTSLKPVAARPMLKRAPATMAGSVPDYGPAVSPTTLSNLAAAIAAMGRPRTSPPRDKLSSERHDETAELER